MRLVLVHDAETAATVGEVARVAGYDLAVARDLDHAATLCRDAGADVALLPATSDPAPLVACAGTGPSLVALIENDHVDMPAWADDFVVVPICPARLRARLHLLQRRRTENDRQRAILAALPDLIFLLDRDGRYLDVVNAPHVELLAAEDVVGRSVHDILPEPVAERSMDAVTRAVDSGEAVSVEYSLELPVGVRHFEARVVPCGPGRALAVVRDISPRTEAAVELERSRRTRDALLQAIPDTMYRIDAEGQLLDYIPAHETPLANWSVERIGESREEIRRKVQELPEELLERVEQAKENARATGDVQVVEFSLASPAGPRFYETRIATCGDDEFLGITRDITKRKLAERELRSAALVKQAFASRVLSLQESERYHVARELHDVVGQMLLVHRMDAEFIADQAAGAEQMREAARALCSKVDDTLRMVRALALGLRPPALDDLGLGSALETLVREIGSKASLAIEVDVEDTVADLSGEVGVALYRVAQEAITNAVRHSGGRKICVSLRNSGTSVELRVEDDGRGISADRARDSASMGLLGIRERSELLGGRATISPRAGGGTVVSATIPRNRHDKHERTHSRRHRR